MGMEGLTPVIDVNGHGGSHWAAPFIGGAVGGAIGSAWNGNRWNYGGYGAPVAPVVANAGCCCDNHVMDAITGLNNAVSNVGRDSASQSASTQSTLCQGFSGVNATIQQVGANIAQNQSRAEAAIAVANLQNQISQKDNEIANLTRSFSAQVQGMNDAFTASKQLSDCCCTTNRNIETQGCETRAAIHAEGEQTRALISQLDRERLLRESSAKDAEIASLKSQAFAVNNTREAVDNVIKHFYAAKSNAKA